MIEQLTCAGNQLRAAWENYCRVYSTLSKFYGRGNPPREYGFPPDLARQLDTELAFISSYEPKIVQIKLGISGIRNYLSNLAPIHTLPSQVLIHIFNLALARPCNLHQLAYGRRLGLLKNPDYLAHVCVRWRRAALFSCSLWSHIDLSLYKPYYKGLVTRAETHIARGGQLPIELHIADTNDWERDQAYVALYGLISRISNRVETLEFVVTSRCRRFHRTVFTKLLFNKQTNIKKLVVRSEGDHSNAFFFAGSLDSDESDDESVNFPLHIPESQVEHGFAPLVALHLRGIFPLWSSPAYHRLVDLRLMSTTEWTHITVGELVAILRSSPGLQTLHFGLYITNSTRGAETGIPVNLQDLQVVKIWTDEEPRVPQRRDGVLRLLAPGLKPIRLCIGGYYSARAVPDRELEGFFARSRVEMFYTRGFLPPMNLLLRHAAHLERVVLDRFDYPNENEHPSSWSQINELASLPRLRSFHVTRSYLLTSQLYSLVGCCPTGIVLHSSVVFHDDRNDVFPPKPKDLSEMFPTVTLIDHILNSSEDPAADWDILD